MLRRKFSFNCITCCFQLIYFYKPKRICPSAAIHAFRSSHNSAYRLYPGYNHWYDYFLPFVQLSVDVCSASSSMFHVVVPLDNKSCNWLFINQLKTSFIYYRLLNWSWNRESVETKLCSFTSFMFDHLHTFYTNGRI